MFRAIVAAVVFFLAAILAAYACHAAPGSGFGSNNGTMPEFIWGAIALVCLVGGVATSIPLIAEEVERKGKL